jgi:hypothetical protein
MIIHCCNVVVEPSNAFVADIDTRTRHQMLRLLPRLMAEAAFDEITAIVEPHGPLLGSELDSDDIPG